MAKRGATNELNHDNWDEEEEVEEAGQFTQAPRDVMQQRVFKTAKRRLMPGSEEDEKPSPFAAFGGFTSTAKTGAPNFSFITSSSSSQASSITPIPTSSPAIPATQSSSQSQPPSQLTSLPLLQLSSQSQQSLSQHSPSRLEEEYENQLRALNKSVTAWIKEHVDREPLCILSPVFQDYDKHLAKLQDKYKAKAAGRVPNGGGSDTDETSASQPKPPDPPKSDPPKPAPFDLGANRSGFKSGFGGSAYSSGIATGSGGGPAAATGSGGFTLSGATVARAEEAKKRILGDSVTGGADSGKAPAFSFFGGSSALTKPFSFG